MTVRDGPILAARTLSSGLQAGEGPALLSDGRLIACDGPAGRLVIVDPDSGALLGSMTVGGGTNGAALGPDGQVYVCNNGGISARDVEALSQGLANLLDPPSAGCIQRLDPASGAFATLYDSCQGRALSAPNDLVFDSAGGFYFTDYGNLRDPAPLRGAIHYALADGSAIRLLDAEVERPNGIGLSPDGKTLYVAETAAGRIWQYPVTGPGRIDTQARSALFHDPAYSMDSLAVQADGRVCVACPALDLILRVGEHQAERIMMPPGWPSNICFGGPDMRSAYVTTLKSGEILHVDWDCPGLKLAW